MLIQPDTHLHGLGPRSWSSGPDSIPSGRLPGPHINGDKPHTYPYHHPTESLASSVEPSWKRRA